MALEGHWVAADAGATGSTVPDRSTNARHGTKTSGCTWESIGGEAAVRCPSTEHVAVPDQAVWDASVMTVFYRGALHGIGGAQGLVSHSQGGGIQPKWVLNYGMTANCLTMHYQTAGVTIAGPSIVLSSDTVYVFVFQRDGSAWKFRIYNAAGALISSGTATAANAFDDATASLQLGWGGESFFNSDTWMIAARFESAALSDAEMDALALDPDLGEGGGGEPEPPAEADGAIRDLLSEPADGEPEGHLVLVPSLRDVLSEPASNNICRRFFA